MKKKLNLQKEIFGDELFISKMKKATTVVKEPASVYEEPALFPEKKEDMSTDKAGLEKATSLDGLEKLICDCTKCRLHQGRNKFVFGTGNPNADQASSRECFENSSGVGIAVQRWESVANASVTKVRGERSVVVSGDLRAELRTFFRKVC